MAAHSVNSLKSALNDEYWNPCILFRKCSHLNVTLYGLTDAL